MSRKLPWRILLGSALFAGVSVASSAQNAQTGNFLYKVKKKESLYLLGSLYFSNPSSYRKIQRINRVINPRRLQIGTSLQIPQSLLRYETIQGRIFSSKGTVFIGSRAAYVGMAVQEGDLVQTGQRSFVSLRLPDGSVVTLPSNSTVRIQRLRRTLLTDGVERLFAIKSGQATGIVTPLQNPFSTFRISTPSAITSVRGTEFRVRYDPKDESSATEVIEGKVAFNEVRGEAQIVAKGFGTNTTLASPVALLPPPLLLDADKVQHEEQLTFTARAMDGATRYRFQIGRNAGFLDMMDEATSSTAEATFLSIANGLYFVRITGIDAAGMEGQPAIYSFERRLSRIRTSIEEGKTGLYRQFLFRWQAIDASKPQFRFQLSRKADGSVPMVDESGLTESSFIITDLPKGTYYWRVMTMEVEGNKFYRKWSSTNELRVEATR